ncbi:MAG: hypothetical protein P9M03_05030 [Candidatus Theseobacter exili]|nr:hypothetical protein [Candidatus Theseobacter exili]
MTSQKQIDANQENAQRSTGAVTQEGKGVISKNAIKHGIFAKDLILKSTVYQESEDEYGKLLYGLIDSLSPQGQIENLLVEKIALDFWRLRRVIRFETGSIKKYLDDVLEAYYNPWRDGGRYLSAANIDQKITETQSYIDWNKKYLQYLRKGVVNFDNLIWKGKDIESNIKDDLYIIANHIDRKLIAEGDGKKLEFGELDLPALKKIIGRAGYNSDQEVTDRLIELYTKLNETLEKEIDDLKEQKNANVMADELNAKLCSLPPVNSAEKVLKYDKSLQKSIFQNLIILKKLQSSLS